jgi:hypothetical protein
LQHRFVLVANAGGTMTASQIVMDLNGDTRHNFNAEDAKVLLKAERRFKELTRAGFTAANRTLMASPSSRTRLIRPQKRHFPRPVGGLNGEGDFLAARDSGMAHVALTGLGVKPLDIGH